LLEDIARTGRERHVSLWNAMQRPRHVPLSFLTESEVSFIFLLRHPQDRKHLQGIVGEQIEEQIPMYHFWYSRPGLEEPKLMMLNLEENKLMEVKK